MIGAGTMGGGIAICFANAGLPVTVLDTSQEALDHGLGVVGKTYDSMVKRGRLTAAEKDRRLALIRGTLNYADSRHADVVIEAVFESLELKQTDFQDARRGRQAGRRTRDQHVDARHRRDRAATRRPGDVIGLHFFSPANVMPLLEVVRTETTAPAVIRTALDLAKTCSKTPVLARVCYGFIGNRMMEGYAREAERMTLEGATPRQVDGALEAWGMAMGILAVFDMAGIDVGVNVHRANADDIRRTRRTIRRISRCTRRGASARRTARAITNTSPGDRAATTIRRRSRSCERRPHDGSKSRSATHSAERSWNAACTR